MNIIKGNPSPKAEEKNFYEISSMFEFGTSPFVKQPVEKYIWTLFKKDKTLGWKKVSNNIKYGEKVPYTFGEKVVGIPYKIEVHKEGKNLLNVTEKKLIADLIVTPRSFKEPVIGRVILLNRGNANINKAKFNESLSAEARTANLFGKEITFYLWQEGASESEKYKKPKTARVDKNGIAKVQFSLMDYATQPTIIDFFSSSKSTKKFFVTASYGMKEVTNRGAVEVSNEKSPSQQTSKPSEGTVTSLVRKSAEIIAEGLGKIGDYFEDKTKTATSVDAKSKDDTENGICPRCKDDITLIELKKICVDKKGNCLITDDKMISAAIPILNKFRKKVGIKTCITKSHFISQLCQETKFYELQERFKFSDPERMRKIFYSYFKQFGSLENQQKESQRLSKISFDKTKWPEVANAIYGKTHPLGKIHLAKDDGWRYSGKGFKQITWKENYINLQKYVKDVFLLEVNWLDNDNPYKLKINANDAMISALAYWGYKGISAIANEISDDAVTNVTKKINAKLEGLDERKRYFKKAVEILEVEKCKPKGKVNVNDEDGTVVIVSGTETKKEKDPAQDIYWVMYKTSVYRNISLKTYYDLEKKNQKPEADYVTYLSRDTHQVESKKLGTLKHSDKRYGQYNEIPPGEYYLVPGVPGQSYKVYVIDSESKTADSGSGIEGVDGDRGGVALHHYCPRFSVGCFTFNSGKNEQPVNDFIKQIPDLKIKDNKPVRFIVQPRKVVESTWNNKNYGTKKWTGI